MTETSPGAVEGITVDQRRRWQALADLDPTVPWNGEQAREAHAALVALLAEVTRLSPAPCDMRHQEPYDFAFCLTHDSTFALGERCKYDGRDPFDVAADEASEQRGLKVRAEIEVERLTLEITALRQAAQQRDQSTRGD